MLFGSVVEKRFPQKGIIRGRGEGRANYFLWAGGILTGVMLLLILVGYVWTPYSTTEMSGADKFLGPCLAHPLGTDNFGRDLLSRIMEGAGSTFSIALCVVLIGGVVGTIIGCLTGYFGGVADLILMRVCDAITAFPSILLALVLISILGPGNKYNVVIALGIVFIPSFARVTRTAFAALRDVNYVKSARLMGASSGRILVRQILPNTTQVLLPAITIGFNNAVLAEASMSYLGIGVTPPDASLGYMLSEAQGMLTSAPWYALGSGGAIVLLIFGVYLPVISGVKELLHLHFGVLPMIIVFGVGVICGALVSVKGIQKSLEKYRGQMVMLILGMLIGSLYAIVSGPVTVDKANAILNKDNFSIVFFLIGLALIVLLQVVKTKLEKKQEKKD